MPHYPIQLSPEGTFKIVGLGAGNFQLQVSRREQFQLTPVELVSVEQNGVPQPGGIDLKEGQQVAGLRVVVKPLKLTGAIRGQIKFENGEQPPGLQIVVRVDPLDGGSSKTISSSREVDSRGRFLIERLPAGTYELKVMIYPLSETTDKLPTQQVTVNENAVSEVTVTIKLNP